MEIGVILPLVLIVILGGLACQRKVYVLRLLTAGLAILGVELVAVLIGGLNGQYFHLAVVESVLNVIFAHLNIYLTFILGITAMLAGLAGLLFTRTDAP